MKGARAFSPCHITGLFEIFDQPANTLFAGSRGAGVCINKGVETIVNIGKASKGSLKVKINGSYSNPAEVSRHVVNAFLSRFAIPNSYRIDVQHHVEVPIGAGFGTSGAAALSLSLALNDVFELGMSDTEAAQIAHKAEIECKTGLGTVIAEVSGGLEIRIKPGAPGIGEIKKIPVQEDYMIVCLISGPLPTKEFLTNEDICKRVNGFGGELINRLVEKPSAATFMHSSRQFAERTNMITERVRKVLDIVDNVNIICSMPMFGETVFTLVKKEHLQQILTIFNRYSSERRILVSDIAFEGARLVA